MRFPTGITRIGHDVIASYQLVSAKGLFWVGVALILWSVILDADFMRSLGPR